MHTFHMLIEKGNLKNSRLICVESYRTQRDEPWARAGATDELSALAMWVIPEYIYVEKCAVDVMREWNSICVYYVL